MMAIPTGQVEAVRLLLSYPCVANSDHLHMSRNDATTAFFWYVHVSRREGGREGREGGKLLLSYPCVANGDHLHTSRNDATTAFFWYVSGRKGGREGGREGGCS